MIQQILGDRSAHWIENDVYSLSTGEFGRWHEIGIARDQNDLIDLTLEGHRGHIKAKAHVYTFLDNVDLEIVIGGIKLLTGQPLPEGIRFWTP